MKYILLLILFILISSCISLNDRPRKLLEVTGIEPLDIHSKAYEFFKNKGYKVLTDDKGTGYILVQSGEYAGNRHGLLRWKERLTLEIEIRRDLSDPDLSIIYGRVNREEKPPTLSDRWEIISLDDTSREKINTLKGEFSQLLIANGANVI